MRSASSAPAPPPGVNAAIMKKVTSSRKARSAAVSRHDSPTAKSSRAASRRGKRTAAPTSDDEILPEYEFSAAAPNPYASRYAATIAEGGCLVVLDPDVAAVFPDSSSVNEALRALAGIIRQHDGGPRKRR